MIDLQINGAYGVDFNRPETSSEDMLPVFERLQAAGVTQMLPTVITGPVKDMVACLSNLVRVRKHFPDLIPGFHIEGPFLSPKSGFVGAHPVDAIRSADQEIMQRLLDAAGGKTLLVTLAPRAGQGLGADHRAGRTGDLCCRRAYRCVAITAPGLLRSGGHNVHTISVTAVRRKCIGTIISFNGCCICGSD